jgi:hypothetical protein
LSETTIDPQLSTNRQVPQFVAAAHNANAHSKYTTIKLWLTSLYFLMQIALTHADSLLDFVAAGQLGSYDEIRGELASAYNDAGLSDVANFIVAAS